MQQQQQQGGSQFGASPPDMSPFTSPGSGHDPHPQQHQQAEAASPISKRPPPLPPARHNFNELALTGTGNYADEEALAAGEEAERGGVPGNRWPRQETLALLKIRSDMDTAFRDATLKGPLWEDVSRKLAELGYLRNAKKCKEKFENVHKYYKRTKEGRAGRQDGKSYRFFSQLEALNTGGGSGTPTTTMAHPITSVPALAPVAAFPATATATATAAPSPTANMPSFTRLQSPPISAPPTTFPIAPPPTAAPPLMSSFAATAGISFSSDTFTSSSSESDEEETGEGGASRPGGQRKRKRPEAGPGGNRKMMAFFEGLMKQVMERQEAMQQRFLETIEKREQDRMIREEAWKRQEMARLNREHELLAQERAMAASRDAAVISFLQKISGQTLQQPPAVAIPAAPIPQPAPPTPHQPHPPQPQPPPQPQKPSAPPPLPPPPQPPPVAISSSTALVPVPDPHYHVVPASGAFEGAGVSPSRWPKSEVHALIKIRSGLEGRYQEAGPKGPLWEEISSGMQRLGYNRSAKRCKEKWENINKYFKKVKESNKKRPEDAKTCPYFHQLDALYRRKLIGSGGANPNPTLQERSDHIIMSVASVPPQSTQHSTPHQPDVQTVQTSNGGPTPSFFQEGTSGNTTMNKPGGTMKELMEQAQQQQAAMDDYDKLEEHDSGNIDDDEDYDDDDDEEDMKMQYKIQFQGQQNVGGGGSGGSGGGGGGTGGGGGNSSSAKATATPTTGSFLAMVQ